MEKISPTIPKVDGMVIKKAEINPQMAVLLLNVFAGALNMANPIITSEIPLRM